MSTEVEVMNSNALKGQAGDKDEYSGQLGTDCHLGAAAVKSVSLFHKLLSCQIVCYFRSLNFRGKPLNL